MQQQQLYKWATVLAIIVLSVVILVYAKDFLIPLTFAALFSMLLLPITRWLEAKGLNKVLSVLAPIVLLVAVFSGIIYLVSWQISELSQDLTNIEQRVTEYLQQARTFIAENLGVSKSQQEQMLKKQQSSSMSKTAGMVTAILGGIGGFLTNLILVLVYMFLMLFLRGRIKGFVLQLVKPQERPNVQSIFTEAQKVTQKYLSGLAIMIVVLWTMYGIGFSIVGVKHAIFFAILCGLFEIIPFIGNLTGTALTILMALVQGGDPNMLLGIVITYAVVQFIQTYLLEPLVVGAEVNINPLFTIAGLVAAEALWGIPGMILAIPVIGILKIIFDHVAPLKPIGYLIGQPEKSDSSMKEKIGSFMTRIKRKISG